MKRWVVALFLILLLFTPMIWWYFQAPIASGLYPEKGAGSIVLEESILENTADLVLPAVWIRSSPWEDPPNIEHVELVGQNGGTIGTIDGEYTLRVDPETPWHQRVVTTQIEMTVNGEIIARKGGKSITPLSNTLESEYLIEELNLSFEGESLSFPMTNTYKIHTIIENRGYSSGFWRQEGMMYLYDQEIEERMGIIINLRGPSTAKLEEIIFWLPGMPDDYYMQYPRYSYEDTLDDYLNNDTFEGKPLTVPFTFTKPNALIYLPFTEEMKEKMKGAKVYLLPYFTFSTSDNQVYHTGGGGSVGRWGQDIDWKEKLIMPIE
ncbi:hypothetical protein GCM10008967_29990 [Bacillus carboniphilus]|uniref:Uncharacterized protein n=1 Tax=Bacillus carboniphilus TaxID=86663 RepID=A0ABP3G6X4_9BACI